MRLLRGTLGALVAASLAGCITPAEFRELEREVEQLRQAQRGEIAGTDTRVADLGAQVLELEQEVSRLRGQVEESSHLAQQALAASETRAARAKPAPEPASPPGAVSPEATAAALEVSEYEEAFRLYRATDYRAAIERFNGFLKSYPSSEYADNAMFWVGECWFKLEDYERAVLTFDEVVKKYPRGNKVPDAHYRQGMALIEIGKRTDDEATYNAAAREIFQKIVTQYPNSERVPEARRQLEKLGS
jgi:tol-pal system protein YbgF